MGERFVQVIVGHKHGSITFDRYGAEFSPQKLKQYMEVLEWDIGNTIQPFDLVVHWFRNKKRLSEQVRLDALSKA